VGRGTFLANTVSAAPYTSASHGAIFSGRYPLHSGLHELYNGDLRRPTIFTHGREAGCRTVMKVDFPFILGHDLGFARDVDDYLVEDDDAFIDAVAAAPSSVSLAHFGGVHVPYGFHSLRFGGDAYREKLAAIEAEIADSTPYPVDQLFEGERDEEDSRLLLRYKRVVQALYAEGAYERLFELYLEGIEHFLAARFAPWLDRLLDRLAGRRVLLVVFGDHGEEWDEVSNGHFNTLAEGVLRVPVILVGDGVGTRTVLSRTRTVDVTPTVLDLAGLGPPAADVDGRSLVDLLEGGSLPDLPALAQAHVPDTPDFVRHQAKQLAGGGRGPLDHVFLAEASYLDDRRLVRTHHEFRDSFSRIVPAPGEVVERFDEHQVPTVDDEAPREDLRAALDAYAASARPTTATEAPDDVRRSLRDFGYRV
jgi:hypothetical protein